MVDTGHLPFAHLGNDSLSVRCRVCVHELVELVGVDRKQRRSYTLKSSSRDELGHEVVEGQKQKRAGVDSVGVTIGQEQHSVVLHRIEIECLSTPRADSSNDRAKFLVSEDLLVGGPFDIHGLALHREDGLGLRVTGNHRCIRSRNPLNNKQLPNPLTHIVGAWGERICGH